MRIVSKRPEISVALLSRGLVFQFTSSSLCSKYKCTLEPSRNDCVRLLKSIFPDYPHWRGIILAKKITSPDASPWGLDGPSPPPPSENNAQKHTLEVLTGAAWRNFRDFMGEGREVGLGSVKTGALNRSWFDIDQTTPPPPPANKTNKLLRGTDATPFVAGRWNSALHQWIPEGFIMISDIY